MSQQAVHELIGSVVDAIGINRRHGEGQRLRNNQRPASRAEFREQGAIDVTRR